MRALAPDGRLPIVKEILKPVLEQFSRRYITSGPQGLKPGPAAALGGTTEVVPFPKPA